MQTKREVQFGLAVLVCGILFVLAATLWPFCFQFRSQGWSGFVSRWHKGPSSILDFPLNVLLFMPIGFGSAAVLAGVGGSNRCAWWLTVLIAFALTVTVEALQIFLPDRTPNVSDVLGNTLGGMAGLGCFRAWQHRAELARVLRVGLASRRIAPLYAAHLLLILFLAWAMMRGVRPGRWEPRYHLALGNEMTGDRAWHGTLRDLILLDRAGNRDSAARLLAGELPNALNDSVVAAYPLDPKTGLKEEYGRLPDLVSKTNRPPVFGDDGVALGDGLWLATQGPCSSLAHRINRSGEFTVALTLTSRDLSQDGDGPARILTISNDPNHRNLTVGQSGSDFVLRWRSFLTGANGTTPELVFPGIFAEAAGPLRIVVTFDGSTARIYTTGVVKDVEFSLGPEAGLGAIVHENLLWTVVAGRFALWPSSVLLSVLIFLPSGVLLGTMLGWAAGRVSQVGLALVGILTPPYFLESFVAFYQRGELRPSAYVLGVAATTLGLGGFVYCARRWWGLSPLFALRTTRVSGSD